MNEELCRFYLYGIRRGFIKYTEKDMHIVNIFGSEKMIMDISLKMLDLEYKAYPNVIGQMTSKQSRRCKEFKRAIELAKSPLSGAML